MIPSSSRFSKLFYRLCVLLSFRLFVYSTFFLFNFLSFRLFVHSTFYFLVFSCPFKFSLLRIFICLSIRLYVFSNLSFLVFSVKKSSLWCLHVHVYLIVVTTSWSVNSTLTFRFSSFQLCVFLSFQFSASAMCILLKWQDHITSEQYLDL